MVAQNEKSESPSAVVCRLGLITGEGSLDSSVGPGSRKTRAQKICSLRRAVWADHPVHRSGDQFTHTLGVIGPR